jgi:diguanylate cyclase (GGDEF)-like protein/PAS domain S-box-containing protein
MQKNLQIRIDSLMQAIQYLQEELAARKKAEAVLRESEARYRSIFDYTAIGLAQVAADGRFIDVNPSFCNILGYSRDELLRMTYLDVTHPDDRQTDKSQRIRLLAGEIQSVIWEKRYVRKDGTVIWTNFKLSITKASEGKSAYLLAAIENISDRKTLQDSLGRMATNLTKMDAMSLSGTWKWNTETNEVTASKEVFQIFALPASRLPVPLELFLERVCPEDRPTVDQLLQSVASGQDSYQFECRLLLPDAKLCLVSMIGERYNENVSGTPRTMIGIARDITRRRKAEQALEESEQRLRQLFDHAVDGIFISHHDGKNIDVNPSACHMMGYSRDELLDRNIRELVRESDTERLLAVRKYLLQNPNQFHIAEWAVKRSNGEYIDTEVSSRILPDGRWLSVVRDISERKRTQMELERYAAEIRDLYDNAPCGYHSLNRDKLIIQINQTELAWLGYTREELIGKKKLTELMTDENQKKFHVNFLRLMNEGLVRDLEFELIRKDGTILPVLLSASATFDDQGNFVKSRATVFDMTEMAEAQKKLRQAAAVFEHTNDAIVITNADRTIVAVNNAFSAITGYRPEEVLGKNPRLLKAERQGDEFYRDIWHSLDLTGKWQGEVWDRRKSGALFPAWESITAVKDHSGKVTDYIAVFSDITTIKESEEKLIELAHHDPLTGLPNRLLFNDRMAQAIAHAKRHHARAALLLLDLDRFKFINDTLGHAAGDRILQVVGTRLKTAIREEDTVARLGGDEFAIIFTRLDHTDDAALLAQKLIRLVSEPIHLSDQALTVSTSIGIGIYPDDAPDPEALSKAADMAMYGAKDKGRNTYAFHTLEMTRATTETLTVDRDLRKAIERNELVLFYQPKVNLSNGRIVGIEALVRWNSPVRGLQLPGRFIQVAEETDLIELIGDWVFDAACTQIKKWYMADLSPVRLAINVSARQIRKPNFVDEMRKRILACYPLDGFGLDLEITESVLQTAPEIVDALKELKSLGIKIAIDDFGTGYSSLNSLKHLPIDVLKIDQSFIHGIPGDSDDKAISSAIIAMGHSLNMSVIAEGIETQEQLQFIMEQHCDEAQGFLFFPPLPVEECEHFLRSGNMNSMFKVFEAPHGRT